MLDGAAVGRYLSVHASTVDQLIRDGLLEGSRHPVRVRREALEACLERCRIKPGGLPWASRQKGRGEDPPITKSVGPTAATGPATPVSKAEPAAAPSDCALRHRSGPETTVGHRVAELWMGSEVETLADLIPVVLRVICVGINPAPTSVAAGHSTRVGSGSGLASGTT